MKILSLTFLSCGLLCKGKKEDYLMFYERVREEVDAANTEPVLNTDDSTPD